MPVPSAGLLRLMVAALPWLVAGCAHSAGGFKTDLLYQEQEFSGRELAGKAIVALRLLTTRGPDTSWAISPAAEASWLRRERGDLKFVVDRGLASSGEGADSIRAAHLQRAFFDARTLDIKEHDSLLASVGAQYVLVTRLRGGVFIKSLDNRVKRRLSIEGELWDTQRTEAVWRVRVIGSSMDASLTDMEFVREGLRRVYLAIPRTPYSGGAEGDW